MPIALLCPTCKAKLKGPDQLVGRTIKCPGCGISVAITTAALVPADDAPVALKPAAQVKAPQLPPKKPVDSVPPAGGVPWYKDDAEPALPAPKPIGSALPNMQLDDQPEEEPYSDFEVVDDDAAATAADKGEELEVVDDDDLPEVLLAEDGLDDLEVL